MDAHGAGADRVPVASPLGSEAEFARRFASRRSAKRAEVAGGDRLLEPRAGQLDAHAQCAEPPNTLELVEVEIIHARHEAAERPKVLEVLAVFGGFGGMAVKDQCLVGLVQTVGASTSR